MVVYLTRGSFYTTNNELDYDKECALPVPAVSYSVTIYPLNNDRFFSREFIGYSKLLCKNNGCRCSLNNTLEMKCTILAGLGQIGLRKDSKAGKYSTAVIITILLIMKSLSS